MPYVNFEASWTFLSVMGYAMRILHVDDDRVVRELLKIGMDTCSAVTVHSFEASKQALNYLEHNEVDLIISDVVMPDIDGPAFIRAIREQRLSTAPVIFLTSGFEHSRALLDSLQPIAILSKPFDPLAFPEELFRILQSAAH